MRYMLDTNVCVDLIRRRSPTVLGHLLRLKPREVCVSVITLNELEFGVAKSAYPERNHVALLEFLAAIMIEPMMDHVAPIYGRIRAELEAKGSGIGSFDMLIAAHALALKTTLVTNNTCEFQRVPGLTLQDWTV